MRAMALMAATCTILSDAPASLRGPSGSFKPSAEQRCGSLSSDDPRQEQPPEPATAPGRPDHTNFAHSN
jgi:hypothetical protein